MTLHLPFAPGPGSRAGEPPRKGFGRPLGGVLLAASGDKVPRPPTRWPPPLNWVAEKPGEERRLKNAGKIEVIKNVYHLREVRQKAGVVNLIFKDRN